MKKIKNKKSFTLVELLVVTAVMLIITGTVIINFNQGDRLKLDRSVAVVSQELREVEEMALASKEIDGKLPDGGYGISFDLGSSYVIFVDKDNNGVYNGGEEEKIERKEIGNKVEISSLDPGAPLSLVFVPPEPKVKINNSFGNLTSEITFRRGNTTKTIYVNKIGLISIKE